MVELELATCLWAYHMGNDLRGIDHHDPCDRVFDVFLYYVQHIYDDGDQYSTW